MVEFIDAHRGRYGVEPICRELPISISSYYLNRLRQSDPQRRPVRQRSDEKLCLEIQRVHAENFGVYGSRKVWKQLQREGFPVARCTIERLMRVLGLRGAARGQVKLTTVSRPGDARPGDLVQRKFKADAPEQLWVADFTYVRTRQGFAYSAFIVDVYSRRIVGWNVASHMRSELVLTALEQALHVRRERGELIHHSDNGRQYLSIAYSGKLLEAGIRPSTGSVGDSYDNALAESIIGLYKTELIRRQGPWRSIQELELATLAWVHWFNNRRLMGPLGHTPPQQYEEDWYSRQHSNPNRAGTT
jgi:transposase InsO family protein